MRIAAVLIVVSAVVACGDPNPPDGIIACAQDSTRACPHHFVCVSGFCYHEGFTADMSAGPGDDGGSDDLGDNNIDLANGPCANAVQDPGEADVDCGGSCPPCAPTKKCVTANDCITQSCTGGFCTLVSGPPNWLSVPALQAARSYHAMAADGSGRVYVFGGSTTSSSSERYTPGAASWETIPSVNNGPECAGATDGTGRPCAVGGRAAMPTNLANCFDPATSTWVALPPLPTNAADFAAATAGGIIHTFGNPFGINTASYAYSSTSNSWVQTANMPEGRGYVAAAAVGSLVVVIGGYDGTTPIATAMTYDSANNSWGASKTAAMSTARVYLAAAAGGDGRLYAIAGSPTYNTTGTAVGSVEAYTPQTNKWVSVPALLAPRQNAAAAVGGDGRIYVAGGLNTSNSSIATVEAYGPVITLSSTSAPAGTVIHVTGSNFAVGATVHIYFDSTTSAAITSASTDGIGTLPMTNWTVPAVAAGAHRVIVVDVRSQFPAYATFNVTP